MSWQEKTSLGGKLFQDDEDSITVHLEIGDSAFEAVVLKKRKKWRRRGKGYFRVTKVWCWMYMSISISLHFIYFTFTLPWHYVYITFTWHLHDIHITFKFTSTFTFTLNYIYIHTFTFRLTLTHTGHYIALHFHLNRKCVTFHLHSHFKNFPKSTHSTGEGKNIKHTLMTDSQLVKRKLTHTHIGIWKKIQV